MRAPPRARAPPVAEGARRTVVVRAAPTQTRAPLVPDLERRAVVVRAVPTRARVPLVPALERRPVVVQALATQVREKPVAALEALERPAVMVQAAPTTQVRVQPVAALERGALAEEVAPTTQVRVQPVAALERGALVVEAAPTLVLPQPVAVLERGELAVRGPAGLAQVRWGIWNRPPASRPLMWEALQWRQSASLCASSWSPARQSPSQSTRCFATTCARMFLRSEVSCWSRMLIEPCCLLFLRHLNICRHFFLLSYCFTPCAVFSFQWSCFLRYVRETEIEQVRWCHPPLFLSGSFCDGGRTGLGGGRRRLRRACAAAATRAADRRRGL